MFGLLPYEPLKGCDRRDSERRFFKTSTNSNVIYSRVLAKMKQMPDFLARKSTRRTRIKSVIVLLSVITFISLYLGGILTHLFEEDFTKYTYPLEIDNITGLITNIDTFLLRQQLQDLQPKPGVVDREAINEAIRNIQAKDLHGNNIVPLSQFEDLTYTLDINPTCSQQWSISQIQRTLLPSSSQQNLLTVIIVVKSAVNNYERRKAIRKSWYLNDTLDSFSFKTVFMVGMCHEKNTVPKSPVHSHNSKNWSSNDCNKMIHEESEKFGDIVQSSGIDSYYNNTIKTYMTLRWLNQRCPADFTLAIDDDYVFEVDNFIDYIYELASNLTPLTNQAIYESAPNQPMRIDSATEELIKKIMSRPSRLQNRRQLSNIGSRSSTGSELDQHFTKLSNKTPALITLNTALNSEDILRNLIALRQVSRDHLWAGYVRLFNHPLRSVLSKWYISRDEYAYNKYPPFITGGLMLMSFKTVKYLYYTTYFTRSFKFDDVYLGMLAYKLEIPALHSNNFMCPLDDYLDANPVRSNSTSCIGVHDIEPKQLEELWETRKKE